jgi:hypothetical protein
MSQQVNLIPELGERCLFAGQTGSGKTAGACWLMQNIPEAPIIIFDTKIEPKFALLPAVVIVSTIAEAVEFIDDHKFDYIVIRPSEDISFEPVALDDMLKEAYRLFHNCPIYIDEIYSFHNNGKAGKGLHALLTRGRSKGITLIMSTQRPAWISRFCITEASKYYIFKLVDKDDRKRLSDVIPDFVDYPAPSKHGFYYFDHTLETPILFKPVKLDPRLDTGYTDVGASANTETTSNASITAPKETPGGALKPAGKHVWV